MGSIVYVINCESTNFTLANQQVVVQGPSFSFSCNPFPQTKSNPGQTCLNCSNRCFFLWTGSKKLSLFVFKHVLLPAFLDSFSALGASSSGISPLAPSFAISYMRRQRSMSRYHKANKKLLSQFIQIINSDVRHKQIWVNKTPLKYYFYTFSIWITEFLTKVKICATKWTVITTSDAVAFWWQFHLLWSPSRQPAAPEETGSPPFLSAHLAGHLPSSKSMWKVTYHQSDSQSFFCFFSISAVFLLFL